MSDTTIDMAKVTQMLDSGWQVFIYRGPMGSYEVRADHPLPSRMTACRRALAKVVNEIDADYVRSSGETLEECVEFLHFDGNRLMTDDFTPEQALTRMAYKTFGEII